MRIILTIDSAPTVRAQEPLARTIFDSILEQEYRKPDSTFFGEWTWRNISCTEEQQEKIKELLVEAYNAGELRYAGWAEE